MIIITHNTTTYNIYNKLFLKFDIKKAAVKRFVRDYLIYNC